MTYRRYTDEEIQRINDAVDIVALISRDIELKKTGSYFRGLCPFHQEKTPSFNVNPTKKYYKCFGCGEHGNAIKWLRKYRNLEFRPALEQAMEFSGYRI
jgi:DNA primase